MSWKKDCNFRLDNQEGLHRDANKVREQPHIDLGVIQADGVHAKVLRQTLAYVFKKQKGQSVWNKVCEGELQMMKSTVTDGQII